jgi:hypothetical protein
MMPNYAKIVDGQVENVIVAEPEWVATQTEDTYVLSTDENPASVGGSIIDGIFVSPQMYPSWTLGSDYKWHAPVSLPEDADTVIYGWDEPTFSWVKMPFSY